MPITGNRKFESKDEYDNHWDHCQANPEKYNVRSKNHHKILQAAVDQKLFNYSDHVIDIFDLDKFHKRLTDLTDTFHEPFFTHALAVKAQAISGILCYAHNNFTGKIGCEGASLAEVIHGNRAGFAPENTVYDSPVKTPEELAIAIEMGFHINLDNSDDMEVISDLLKQEKYKNSKSTFGVRLNPLAGVGAIAALSTAGVGSKFGMIYCDKTFDQILGYFKKYKFLTGLHAHVGSQGCSLEQIGFGAKTVCEAAEKLNQALKEIDEESDRINILDIGGGVSTSYDQEEDAVPFIEYRKVLEKMCPESLFSGKFRIITEFGRSVFTKCGVTITEIFSIKDSNSNGTEIDKMRQDHNLNPILFSHVGSNVFYREVYQPENWRRRFTLYKSDGSRKEISGSEGETRKYDIAGPLCFQGDYLCKNVLLPENLEKGDLLMMHETGGYSMALYSKYNSRASHNCYGWSESQGFQLLKPKQTMDENLGFWGPYSCK